jgi:Fic family protein
MRHRFDRAHLALGRLDAVTSHLPNRGLLLYSFVRKEAVLSSQIEGTQSSLADLMLHEVDEQPGVPIDDVREVSRCVAALERGCELLAAGLPFSVRLLSQVHEVLMGQTRGRAKLPGEVRRSQVWIGGSRPGNARFVPPPPGELAECLGAFERFLHDQPEPTPPLLKAALAHVQFETIHPFLDGNGRVGRLLIVLQFVADGLLRWPMLYPSLFFKAHRSTYYDLLDQVRLAGEWERWLDFFAEGIEVSATQAASTATELRTLIEHDRARIAALGRAASSTLAVHEALQKQPIATANHLVGATGLTAATVNRSLARLEGLGVVEEITSRRRGRVFSYERYVSVLGRELGEG